MKINYKKLIIFILIPLLLGALVGIIAVRPNKIDSIIPAWIFPIVWTILYILMGISSYIVDEKTGSVKLIYIIQLIFNLLWSFIFFEFRWFLFAFIWIIALIILVFIMIIKYKQIDKLAGLLQVPYLIWLFIAMFLNSTFL